MTISIELTPAEEIAIRETADLNNSGVHEWAKRMILNATVTNDEDRFKVRREIEGDGL